MNTLLALGTLLLAIVPWDDNAKWRRVGKGIASTYRPWRKSATVPFARYPGNWGVKPTPRDLVCAHRTIPFGTILRLRLRARDRAGFCVVLDRGPYGFCHWVGDNKKRTGCKRGYQYTIKKRVKAKWPGYYRGLIDATPAVHRMMGSRGWEVVTVDALVGRERRRRRRVLRLSAL